METIKLLLAYADRRVSNVVETALLDVFYDQAVVQSTRTSRMDDLVRQGSLWDLDLIVVGADTLFQDRHQQALASIADVVSAIQQIRLQHSTPIVALTASSDAGQLLLDAGVDAVLPLPLNPEQLKAELRSLLDLNGIIDDDDGMPGAGSLVRGFSRMEEAN